MEVNNLEVGGGSFYHRRALLGRGSVVGKMKKGSAEGVEETDL